MLSPEGNGSSFIGTSTALLAAFLDKELHFLVGGHFSGCGAEDAPEASAKKLHAAGRGRLLQAKQAVRPRLASGIASGKKKPLRRSIIFSPNMLK